MNKIEKLLNELCPNGVEFKSLGEVCEVVKGQQLNKNLLLESGLYPVMNGGINPSGYWDTYNKNAQTITISQGGASAGYVNFMQTPFWAGAHCYTIEKVVEFLNYKFVYYFLKNNQNNLIKSQYGAGIPALNKTDIQNLQIPIPPLEIQEEIVKILDAFTELEARRRQYEYYRNKLLSFEYLKTNGGGYKLKMLGEICERQKGINITAGEMEKIAIQNGDIRIFAGGKTFIDTKMELLQEQNILKKTSIIVKSRGYVDFEYYTKPFTHKNELWSYSLNPDTKDINLKFIFYYLKNKVEYFQKIARANAVKIPQLAVADTDRFQIPIPPLATQEKIVNILDQFHALTTDLQSGIPAEIEARKKQYEYYRNQLLTFKEAI
ncbi:restriction endonuclease subunit S [Campylobacter jejuni]|uniref:restriction endonuclease subunit S n=1 Tax=Campylobacter jejuni TaxID=197 RepID=UPI00138439E3|nr:restriction endonuclease subunit S [Campylobacter jejuni]EAI4846187.1 restriction endonuclease subunit S [Campylobacter jejuni]EAI6346241.1 restriction endonuclease subunit S [Campylobacter jejuni]EAI8631283.1 restriction endonuclease subunit S [Campylobacter jejuni]ECR2480815.1 restriction endonuclease subunit S [Campylobacter jejuni]EDP4435144.1 restriction endonuclease subunit S [Campylobacter jejuni]